MIYDEDDIRMHVQSTIPAGHFAALIAVIQDEAGQVQRRVNLRLQRGEPLTAEDWPKMQVDQGRIQALHDLVLRLERYAAPKPETSPRREMDI